MKRLIGNKGQVAVEYALIITVVITVTITIMTRVRDMLNDPSNGAMVKLVRTLESNIMGGNNETGAQRYKRFKLVQ